MNSFGEKVKITLFGESHGDGIGIVIDQLASGIELDFTLIESELKKRRPKNDYSTPRQESDSYQVLSGLYEGKTTGAPLVFFISNQNKQSQDYDELKSIMRPGHADYPAYVKFQGFNDPRGGGMFSGRVTVAMMIIGAIAKQILLKKGITVVSHIQQVHSVNDDRFTLENLNESLYQRLLTSDFPVINPLIETDMKAVIMDAKNQSDSVGGVVESAIMSMPAGIGSPLFQSVESYLSSLLFSIPAVKGVEFGSGFELTHMMGSEANDSYHIVDNKVQTSTNHNGGITGGITNGMPVIVRCAIKPTSSIGKPQNTVNIKDFKNTVLSVQGRHDPAIVHRIVFVINAALNYAVLDLMSSEYGLDWMR